MQTAITAFLKGRLRALVLTLCTAAALPPVAAGEGGPPGEPVWARQPGYGEISAVYPQSAERHKTLGKATIRCRMNSDGELKDCSLLDESPVGAGFGAKALLLYRVFRVQLSDKGSPKVGQTVQVSIDFTPLRFARVRPEGPTPDPSSTPQLVRWMTGPVQPGYPPQARYTGISGRVVLRCKVGRRGALSLCSTVEEWPKGYGFGAAAERDGNRTRVSSKTVDGAEAEGLLLETVVVSNPPCTAQLELDRRLNGCPPDLPPFHPNGAH